MSFVRRFRIYVHQYLYFERMVSEDLGPAYADCPAHCTRPEADQPNECPNCEWQVKRREFEKETWAIIQKKSPGLQADIDWPLSHLRSTMNTVIRAHVQRPRGYVRTWSVLLAQLVETYRDEVSKMRAVDAWNLKQKLKREEE